MEALINNHNNNVASFIKCLGPSLVTVMALLRALLPVQPFREDGKSIVDAFSIQVVDRSSAMSVMLGGPRHLTK